MIIAQSLTRQFDKRGIAGLHGLSFTLSRGKIMAVMGPNGSGKTTLLKILSGEIKQDEGDFEVEGRISCFPTDQKTENINVQRLLVNSVNLTIDEDKKIQLARDLADTFEFTFQLRQNFPELSSGQKQKILLAQQLINRPGLLLLDEPFSHLDPFSRRDILRGLFQYIRDQGISVLWVTHDLEEAFLHADLIGLMQFGKFVQSNTPEEMVRNPKSLFSAQFMGYRNFFAVKSNDGLDAVLIVPDHAWKFDQEGSSYTVIKRHAGIQTMEYVLTKDSKLIYLVRGAQLPLIEIGIQLSLSPILEECITIPL